MRFAVISDIHGNAMALDAVLADIARQGIEDILCLGDNVSGPVDPAGAAERLMRLSGPFVAGNHDRWTVDLSLKGSGKIDAFARGQLDATQLAWLDSLPAIATHSDSVFLCHGTPSDDEAPWLDRFFDGRTTTLPNEADVAAEAKGLDYELLLCGHTHMPRSLRLLDGRLIVNPGSVGMQLVHGSPDARYAVLERRSAGWHTVLLAVPYDHAAAARLAAANGFPQWAASLTNGWVGPESLSW
ncbi:MAG: metallophosphoesterase family protein [Candidatus Devosia phytovorans]|uniref:Metallophosphoesterase family protein n=1 Tax=Candidatus Devosia phytovorans TaxID=3121372 RepID=A0AAJ5VWH3_9HYPH|nr:metallophosphoesterase family protein [Devosia sp.]WEK05205.1 MAG: metallophosphoesterase family protein [Devosia sp.]